MLIIFVIQLAILVTIANWRVCCFSGDFTLVAGEIGYLSVWNLDGSGKPALNVNAVTSPLLLFQ